MSNPYMQEAQEIRKAIDTFAKNQSDETLIDNKAAFLFWQSGIWVNTDEIYRFSDDIYRVLQPHTTQDDWTPDKVPALFVIISGDWKEWKPGSYAKGTKRKHFGKKWVSNVDGNIWEPGAAGVYTWDEFTESEE